MPRRNLSCARAACSAHPPCRELWRLLRPATSPLGVTVDSEVPVPAEGDAADYADAHSSSSSSGAGGSQRGDAEGEQPSSPKRVGDRTLMLMDPSGGQKAGEGAELVAAQLKEALTVRSAHDGGPACPCMPGACTAAAVTPPVQGVNSLLSAPPCRPRGCSCRSCSRRRLPSWCGSTITWPWTSSLSSTHGC